MEAGRKSLYRQIMDTIVERIDAGDFSYEVPLCTERQLIERYKVSRITAQRAIDELVREGLLYRVKGVGSFVSRPDAPARHSVGADAALHAFVLPRTIAVKGMLPIIQALSGRLTAGGHYLSLSVGEPSDPLCEDTLRKLLESPVAGVAYYPISRDMPVDLLMQCRLRGKNVVIVDKESPSPLFSNVVPDSARGGLLMGEHLLALGHTRVAYLAVHSMRDTSTIADRYLGLYQALRNDKIEPRPEYLRTALREGADAQQNADLLREAVRAFYEAGATAVFCENDNVAFRVVQACRALGIRVPGQMSVCGFDNSDFATIADPPLTTIEQSDEDIGAAVADILLQEPAVPRRVVIPVSLIERGSTGPAAE